MLLTSQQEEDLKEERSTVGRWLGKLLEEEIEEVRIACLDLLHVSRDLRSGNCYPLDSSSIVVVELHSRSERHSLVVPVVHIHLAHNRSTVLLDVVPERKVIQSLDLEDNFVKDKQS